MPADGNPPPDRSHQATGESPIEAQLARAEQLLRESEERYHELIETSTAGFFIRQDDRFVYVNSTLVKMLGASSHEELLGQLTLDRIHPDSHTAVYERLRQLSERERLAPISEEKFVRLDGSVIDVDLRGVYCMFQNRPAQQVVVRDITDLKRSQTEAREHQAKLAHVMRVNTMGKMVSELAHEISQPLYAITNYTAACRETLIADEQKYPADLLRWVEQISVQASRAGEIIRHVGQFVRKTPPQREPVQLNDLIRDVARLLELDARAHHSRMRLALQPSQRLAVVDRVQIEQVVVNLTLNAIEAMDDIPIEERLVTITSRYEAQEVEVSVHDHGRGVPKAIAHQLFEPFFSTKLSGMGMGLAVSRSIVEGHNGRLWVRRTRGAGMTFCFRLLLEPA